MTLYIETKAGILEGYLRMNGKRFVVMRAAQLQPILTYARSKNYYPLYNKEPIR